MTTTGGFTLPGEAGHEAFTLAMAQRWGADVIRDSDGTQLSDEILGSGHGIYSTLCLIREDNAWAKAHPRLMQQNFLMSRPVTADGDRVEVRLLDGYSTDQFVLNDWDGVEEFWQVHDRTAGTEVPAGRWTLADGVVTVTGTVPGHTYTVNFLVMRVWEEISMYNHVTNDWGDREHLMAVEPRYPEVAEHILDWLDRWCVEHPATTVVRFTSLFYNFAWFWGSDANLPHVYADWGSYDFTVNPVALRAFREETGLTITSEDFVNAGRYTSTHNPPSDVYRRWTAFVGDFVRDLGRRCVDVVHRHGKKAYVFYDDSWIGLEPYSGRFAEMGFDGLIKAVFSGYEARLCAGVDVPVHELRLHPYLFPVDLEGRPTFQPGVEGADPTADLRRYWVTLRRALLRARIDRIGLGGYLSLVEPFADFQDEVAQIAEQHRRILALHGAGGPVTAPVRVGVLTAWGALRSWTCSGHLHENPDLSLLHVLESLAGLGFDVGFHRLDEVAEHGVPAGVDVLVNAGPQGTAWSGGGVWADPRLVAAITTFVRGGGGLLGVEQPSAADVPGRLHRFQLAEVLGVDQDGGDRHVVARRRFVVDPDHPVLAAAGAADDLPPLPGLHVLRDDVRVLAAADGVPVATAAQVGRGRAVYLSGHRHGPASARRLEDALWWASGRERTGLTTSDPGATAVEIGGVVLVSNDTLEPRTVQVLRDGVALATLDLAPAALHELPA